MKHILTLFVSVLVIVSCKKDNQLENEIASINIDVTVDRFDRFFAETTINDFSKIKQAFPFMFSEKDTDSSWAEIKRDTFQLQLLDEVNKVFTSFEKTEKEIESLFNHLKYYFPEFRPPRIITTTNFVRYRNRVVVTDTISVIALDSYLGSNHEFYGGIQKYIVANLRKEQIVVDLAKKYAEKYIHQEAKKTLLDEMVFFGKQLYFKDVVIPFVEDEERIGYTTKQLDWARANESYIWRYFVERELLYSTDSKLPSRFINPAPFSKFYLEEIDSESPGQLGQYIGWQIVRAYMNNNDVSLKEMLIKSPEEIFNKSKFKPRK
ncbi:gliding motility lipoprotein GldB [uncultured Algibacter sp.]|uniref:gliding motility lipoprotein GldB n=1 Tax=uncultured Algibacter sp. TaxID=298659 RepID=UPI00260BB576|nr:gliding motility lipoprotein GldB [uncultured Algibacter sp.]